MIHGFLCSIAYFYTLKNKKEEKTATFWTTNNERLKSFYQSDENRIVLESENERVVFKLQSIEFTSEKPLLTRQFREFSRRKMQKEI